MIPTNFEEFCNSVNDNSNEGENAYGNKFDLKLFTTRNKILASKWLIENKLDGYFSDITNVKELSWLIIDDRCLTFEGDYSMLKEKISNFNAWYK